MTLTLAEREFLNSLTLYLATKRTSLGSALKLRAPLSAVHASDLRIHYSNYFISLLSAIELMRDGGRGTFSAFEAKLQTTFAVITGSDGKDCYGYIRELRNAIVHRGLNIFSAAHFRANFPLLVAPSPVPDRSGDRSYTAFSFYLIGVIEKCELVVGPTMEACLNEQGLLNRQPDREESVDEILRAVEESAAIPYWVKKTARKDLSAVDFESIHRANIDNLAELLKPNPISPQLDS